jgi:hypothetical protein
VFLTLPQWIVSKTNNILKLGKNGIFPIVVSALLFKFIKSTPPKPLSYQDLKNSIPQQNSIFSGNSNPFVNSNGVIWIPVQSNYFTNQTPLLLEQK